MRERHALKALMGGHAGSAIGLRKGLGMARWGVLRRLGANAYPR